MEFTGVTEYWHVLPRGGAADVGASACLLTHLSQHWSLFISSSWRPIRSAAPSGNIVAVALLCNVESVSYSDKRSKYAQLQSKESDGWFGDDPASWPFRQNPPQRGPTAGWTDSISVSSSETRAHNSHQERPERDRAWSVHISII